jgi:hypothetical protein
MRLVLDVVVGDEIRYGDGRYFGSFEDNEIVISTSRPLIDQGEKLKLRIKEELAKVDTSILQRLVWCGVSNHVYKSVVLLLQNCPNIRSVSLDNGMIASKEFRELLDYCCDKIDQLKVGMVRTDSIDAVGQAMVDFIRRTSCLQELRWTALGQKHANAIFLALKFNSSIRKVIIGAIRLDASIVADVLNCNSCLEEIVISCFQPGLFKLFEALANHPSLLKLNLVCSDVLEEIDVVSLGNALLSNSNLFSLKLEFGNIAVVMQQLCKSLSSSKTLTELQFYSSSVRSEKQVRGSSIDFLQNMVRLEALTISLSLLHSANIWETFCENLAVNMCLQRLTLVITDYTIVSKSIQPLCESARNNQNLKSLTVKNKSKTWFEDGLITHFVVLLENNTSLTKLNLIKMFRNLSDDTVAQFCRSLENAHSLQKLTLLNQSGGRVDEFVTVVRSNRSIFQVALWSSNQQSLVELESALEINRKNHFDNVRVCLLYFWKFKCDEINLLKQILSIYEDSQRFQWKESYLIREFVIE